MKLNKRLCAIFICGASLLAKPAWSFWPVFDFMEIIPIGSEISTGLDVLRQAKSQMTQLTEGLGAIGSSIKTISSYGEDLSKLNEAIEESGGEAINTVNNNLNSSKIAIEGITNVLASMQNAQQGFIGQFIAQTENFLNSDAYSQTQRKTDNEIKIAYLEEIIIEEEEEEEVAGNSTQKDEIISSFNRLKEENAQIRIQTNDALDLALSNLNLSAEMNQKVLETLKEILAQTDKISLQNKNDLQKEIQSLIKKEQNLSEQGIDIIESTKERYNLQSKEKIEDGLNNYKKIIVAYLNGNAEREDITTVGNEFKSGLASINMVPDTDTVKKYRQETIIVQNELDKLKKEIEKAAEN